jgi:oligoribonuclease NrnB/cAMP/cGMP phosphodiesterase (DHH superfamily)
MLDKTVLHLTHTDLDGVGCAVLSQKLYKGVLHTFCDYGDKYVTGSINKAVHDILDLMNDSSFNSPFDLILITDISVDEETSAYLDKARRDGIVDVRLIDHHENSSKWLEEKYEWASVNYMRNGQKTSGTSEMFELLFKKERGFSFHELEEINKFAQCVRSYDTFDWVKTHDDHAEQMNVLFSIIGRDAFIERFRNDISIDFNESEVYRIETFIELREKEIKRKLNNVRFKVLNNFVCGIVFSESHRSLLGKRILDTHPHVRVAVIIDITSGKVSYRTRDGEGIHAGEFAKKFGGNGHPAASGSQFDKDIHETIYDNIFKEVVLY